MILSVLCSNTSKFVRPQSIMTMEWMMKVYYLMELRKKLQSPARPWFCWAVSIIHHRWRNCGHLGGHSICHAKMDLIIAGKEFDITAYHQRYIGLEILYVGWQYMGSTYQPKEENTVEAYQSAPQLYGRLPLPRKLPKNTRAYWSGISLLFFALSCGISRLVIKMSRKIWERWRSTARHYSQFRGNWWRHWSGLDWWLMMRPSRASTCQEVVGLIEESAAWDRSFSLTCRNATHVLSLVQYRRRSGQIHIEWIINRERRVSGERHSDSCKSLCELRCYDIPVSLQMAGGGFECEIKG